MMEKIISYRCGICRAVYSEESDAQDCEDRGVITEDMVPLYVMFEETGFYKNILFCVVKSNIESNRHYCDPSLWACRDTGVGDSLGDDICGGGGKSVYKSTGLLNTNNGYVDIHSDRFKRMASFLKSRGLPVRYWNGKEIITYKGE